MGGLDLSALLGGGAAAPVELAQTSAD